MATHLARVCNLDFLFADRTFSNLNDIALFNFGKIAYWVFRFLNSNNSDSVYDYLNANCYKVVSADPGDSMINDLASLKSGISMGSVIP